MTHAEYYAELQLYVAAHEPRGCANCRHFTQDGCQCKDATVKPPRTEHLYKGWQCIGFHRRWSAKTLYNYIKPKEVHNAQSR